MVQLFHVIAERQATTHLTKQTYNKMTHLDVNVLALRGSTHCFLKEDRSTFRSFGRTRESRPMAVRLTHLDEDVTQANVMCDRTRVRVYSKYRYRNTHVLKLQDGIKTHSYNLQDIEKERGHF